MAGQRGLAGFQPEGDAIARKAFRAKARGTGMRLTAEEVLALHEMEGDGDWWQSFAKLAPPNKLT